MKKTLLTVMALLIATPAFADSDYWGVPYPEACSKEATAKVFVKELRVSQSFLDKATGERGHTGTVMPTGAIAILKTLTGELYEDTRRHEICHLIAGEFHGRVKAAKK